MSDFQQTYKPLDLSRRQIRLANIRPLTREQSPEEPLTISVNIHSFDQAPNYVALSYEWGSPNDISDFPVKINGKAAKLRQNLVLALQNIRKRALSLSLWIDAICVRQHDAAELENQVCFMGKIFSRAHCVFSWLGPAQPGSDLAFAFLNDIWNEEYEEMKVNFRKALSNPASHEALDAIEALLDRSYWSRAWIIQELAANFKRCLLLCGDGSITLFQGAACCLAFHEIQPEWRDSSGDGGPPRLRYTTTKSKRHQLLMLYVKISDPGNATLDKFSRRDILGWMKDFPSQIAMRPQDKVFSLLGLADAMPFRDAENQIKIDYRSPEEIIFRQIAIATMKGTRSFSIFGESIRRPRSSPIFGESVHRQAHAKMLPSWVPDWSLEKAEYAPPGYWRRYSLAGEHYTHLSIDESQSVLKTAGHVISKVSDVFSHKFDDDFTVLGVLMELLQFLGKQILTPDSDSKAESFTRIVHQMYYLTTTLDYSESEAEDIWPIADFCRCIEEAWSGTDPRSLTFSQERLVTLACGTHSFIRCHQENNAVQNEAQQPPNGVEVFGVASLSTEIGDVIAAIPGSQHLVILRPTDEAQHYRLAGLAVIRNYTNEEALAGFSTEAIYIH